MKKEIIRKTLFSNKITSTIVEISYDKRKIKKYLKKMYKRMKSEFYALKPIYLIFFDEYAAQSRYLTNYSRTGISENMIYDKSLIVVFHYKYKKVLFEERISSELVNINFMYEDNFDD